MTSRFCTLTSKFFSLEVMTSWKFMSIENPEYEWRSSGVQGVLRKMSRGQLLKPCGGVVGIVPPEVFCEVRNAPNSFLTKAQLIFSSLSASAHRYGCPHLSSKENTALDCVWHGRSWTLSLG